MKIKKITNTKLDNPIILYDIGVEDDHTFFVGNEPNGRFVLTHNSMPDIDSDCSDRETAIDIIKTFFGEENVIPVSNFNQLQLRSLIKDVSRLYNIPFEEVNLYTGKIEGEALEEAKKTPGFDRAGWVLTYEEAENNSASFREFMEKYPDFEKTVKVLFKQMRNCFTGNVKILTNNGNKKFSDICKIKDKIAFINQEGFVSYNSDYELLNQGIKQVYIISLENGKSLELTSDHEVMTQNGYKKVSELLPNDSLISFLEQE